MTLSIPIKNKIMPSSMFRGRNDDTRRKKATIEKIIIRIPSPIFTVPKELGRMLCIILSKRLDLYKFNKDVRCTGTTKPC